MRYRASGILLHISSLPSRFGIGDMGPEAYKFVDFLASCGQNYWQILPLNSTDPLYDNSPYHSVSAFAFNPLLISPELMVRDGLLKESELPEVLSPSADRVDFNRVIESKTKLFPLAYGRFKAAARDWEYERFCLDNAWWLEDFALYSSLKDEFTGKNWADWPAEYRDRKPEAMSKSKRGAR